MRGRNMAWRVSDLDFGRVCDILREGEANIKG